MVVRPSETPTPITEVFEVVLVGFDDSVPSGLYADGSWRANGSGTGDAEIHKGSWQCKVVQPVLAA
jgi:hypothetical protein